MSLMKEMVDKTANGLWLMRQSLDEHSLVICVKWVDEGYTSIRFILDRNPLWYRQLCAAYIVNRKKPRKRKAKYVDTRIRRKGVINALDRLIETGDTQSIYKHDLLDIAERIEEHDLC